MDDGLEVMQSMGKDKLPLACFLEGRRSLLSIVTGFRIQNVLSYCKSCPEIAEIIIPWI